MNIAYYMPFKPLDHPNPSGDLVTGTELYNYLANRGHRVELASRLRCRWIYYRPAKLLKLLLEQRRIVRNGLQHRPDIWLSYHCYYKAPDLLGPLCSRKLQIPYVIFQGIYSTKRRKKLTTRAGFFLNKRSLQAADHIFTNKHRDHRNLTRIVAEDRLSYIAPGIHPGDFQFSKQWRVNIRQQWGCRDEVVVMTAAMMRPGVKTEGITGVIEACSSLHQKGYPIRLVICGDGQCREQLEKRAREAAPLDVQFLGRVPRSELYKSYSGADFFVFPGIDEALGMVYLEAQSCGLPVVAYSDWGGGEAVVHRETGLISPSTEREQFTENIKRLIIHPELRLQLGKNAVRHVHLRHDIERNYHQVEEKLRSLRARTTR